MITGIIVALPDELSSLTKTKVSKGQCVFINDNVVVAVSGAGPVNATIASELLITNGAERLISWGCAAALNEQLLPGDLILAEQLISESRDELSLQSSWLEYITEQLSHLAPLKGPLLESSSIIALSENKLELHQQTRAIALDMESIAIAKTAKKHAMPAAIIRCIADPVNMNLPESVSYAMNDQGDIIITKLLTHLVTHLNEIPDLIKLGIHFNAAKNKLKLVSKHLDIIVGFEQKQAIS